MDTNTIFALLFFVGWVGTLIAYIVLANKVAKLTPQLIVEILKFDKANSLEEKLRGDALEEQLDKVNKTYKPEVNKSSKKEESVSDILRSGKPIKVGNKSFRLA